MKKLIRYSLLVMLIALAATGCAAEDDLTIPTLTETIPPTNTLAPTVTATLPPPTATHTLTPTPYLKECIQLEEVDQIDSEGVVALWLIEPDVLILDRLDGTERKSLGNFYASAVASPDHSQIAYFQQYPKVIVIASYAGQIIQVLPTEQNWGGVIDWLPDDRLLIESNPFYGSWKYGDAVPSSLIVYDLATGKFEEILPDFPDIFPFVESYPNWAGNMTFIPDPKLVYTFYYAGGLGNILWDIENQIEIMRLYGNGSQSRPTWSRNGEWFITNAPMTTIYRSMRFTNYESELPYVRGSSDLLMVSASGEIQRLTYLGTEYRSEESAWVLSPDETKLAFWVDTDFEFNHEEWQLAILDIPSKELKLYCVSGGNYRFPEPPVWSPSGDRLMVTKYFVTMTTGTSGAFFIDLEKNQIAGYIEKAHGVGWLTLGE